MTAVRFRRHLLNSNCTDGVPTAGEVNADYTDIQDDFDRDEVGLVSQRSPDRTDGRIRVAQICYRRQLQGYR